MSVERGTGKPLRRSQRGEQRKEEGRAEREKLSISDGGFITLPRCQLQRERERHKGKYVSVYSIIHSVSYCHPDTFRMHVSCWFEVWAFFPLFRIFARAYKMDVFTFFCESAALNTCVSEMRLIKFDE